MNGVITQKESLVTDRKPVITCAGELEVFSGLEDSLSFALPQDPCEWRRSLGRPVRNVHIGVRFTPFSPEALPRENQWDLIRHPLFHVYWTECIDVDVYKTSVRDDIEIWLKELNARNITDWLIVVVETFDIKRANKLLPRTTVLDKIRADFAPKQGDRCISVLNPSRQENRTADSWRGLVARVRYLVLVAYARAVTKLEEHVRAQRERRNEPGWHFIRYFRLQEELAQVLEMLGLHDEALVQYDELDALFSQFVVNSHAGDAASWLSEFQRPLDRWHGLKLELPSVQPSQLQLVDEPSLLELRAYLYARQSRALLASNRPWEMAARCLPFLHGCVRELALLEVQATPGAVNCWLFLAALEVLHACERRTTDSAATDAETHSLHTAALWAYAARKLRELGELCGLMPRGGPTSDQLHLVVGLSSGMGDCPGELPHRPSPTDKLKEALCSQEAFNRHYLELSELAMGTYKHVGRLRSARLVGRELASFYRLLGETNKAAAFLGDALKTFEQENWRELAVQTQLELAACYNQANDLRRYVRACAIVSAAPEMDTLVRCTHFDDMLNNIEKLEKPLLVPFVNIFKIISVNLKCESIVMQDSYVNIDIEIECNFPRKIVCSNLMLSLETEKIKKGEETKCLRNITSKDMKVPDLNLQRLKIQKHLDYRQDKQIASASVVCKTAPLKRADSNAKPPRSEFLEVARPLTPGPIALTPGVNQIQLQWKCGEPARYYLGQVLVKMGHLEFLSLPIMPKLRFEVKREEPSLRLDKTGAELLAGLPQTMQLTVTIGSYPVEEESSIKITCSKGLSMQDDPTVPLSSNLSIPLVSTLPHSRTSLTLQVFSELPAKDQLVQLQCPWNMEPVQVALGFSAPLTVTWRLHTAKRRKFVQILVTGQCSTKIRVDKIILSSDGKVTFVDLNPTSDQSILSNGLTISYMWEINVESDERKPLKAEFSMEYAAIDDENSNVCTSWKQFKYNFDIVDYETLYLVEAKVEPSKGSEFCRVGALCHLRLSICPATTTDELTTKSLMYEVLAEQSVWAVCGRTAGVVSVAQTGGRNAAQVVTLDVMPLASGYLPLPLVRLSKYIPADKTVGKSNPSAPNAHPRLEPFTPGQVYNGSKGQQIHVLAAANELHIS